MAYEPTEWKSGDVVTSAKLNKIEGGIVSGGVLVVTDTDGTLDKTWQEIHDSPFCVWKSEYEGGVDFVPILGAFVDPDQNLYHVSFQDAGMNDSVSFAATSANGYPVLENGQ